MSLNFLLSFRNPNTPVNMEHSFTTMWPVYDFGTGKYLNITRHINPESIQGRFCAKSFNFWNVLIPGIIEAEKHGRDGKSYFSPSGQEKCSSEDNCDD